MFEETAESITLHGLGFLQVKLQGHQRLHVWHPDLPRRSCCQWSQIHDHRFSFTSRVLVGTQINHMYRAKEVPSGDPMATHLAYLHEGSRSKFGNRPWILSAHIFVTRDYQIAVNAGQDYSVDAYDFHSTEPGNNGKVATIMTKKGEGTAGARSLCEISREPDVDFDRKQWPEDRLWAIVRDVLGS